MTGNEKVIFEEKKQDVKFFWKSFIFSGITILAILIVLLGCIAWFVANNQAKAGSAALSVNGSYTYSIATLASDAQGVYDVNESPSTKTALAKALNKFFRADNNGRDDDTGNHYTSFLNLPNLSRGTSIFTDKTDGKEYILGDSDGISLMVNSESNVNNTNEFEHVGPGSYGKFTFYIIPHIDNLNQVKLSVSLMPFTLVREGAASDKKATGRAVLLENNDKNTDLINILRGHILLFAGKDGNGNYTNRIMPSMESNESISFEFTKVGNANWEKDKPEPVTIYWIWPKRFENIKYYGQEESVYKTECDSHRELLEWINGHRSCIVKGKELELTYLANPTLDLTNQEFAQWSTGYNKGDQLIGDTVAYFQWVIDAV